MTDSPTSERESDEVGAKSSRRRRRRPLYEEQPARTWIGMAIQAIGRRCHWELTAMKLLVRPVLWAYHHRKTVVGTPTFGKRRLVAFSHPFHLLDPAHVHLSIGRGPLYYMADSRILFGTPRYAWLSRRCRVLPLHRKQAVPADAPAGTATGHLRENVRFLHHAIEKMEQGASVAMAPEGRSTAQRTLWRFKAGIARLAFDTERELDWRGGVRVVLVGITYRKLRRPYDGSVTVALGEPVPVADWKQQYQEDRRAAERDFLDRLEAGMRELTVDFEGEPSGFVEDLSQLIDADRRARRVALERDDRVPMREAVQLSKQAAAEHEEAGRQLKVRLANWLRSADQLMLLPGVEGRKRRLPPLLGLILESPSLLGFVIFQTPFRVTRARLAELARNRNPKTRSRAGTEELFAALNTFAAWVLGGILLCLLPGLLGFWPFWWSLVAAAAYVGLGALTRRRFRFARLCWLQLRQPEPFRAFCAESEVLRAELHRLREMC